MVMRKIKLNRGKLANLPQLELGEPAVATDDGSLHIGTEQGNVKLAKDADVQAVSQQLADKAGKKEVDEKVARIVSGSPKGVYDTLTALQTALPDGDTGVYVVSEDGNWYFWNGTAWESGGTYQASELAKDDVYGVLGIPNPEPSITATNNLTTNNAVWTPINATLTETDGTLTMTATASGGQITKPITFVPGHRYWVRATVRASSNRVYFYVSEQVGVYHSGSGTEEILSSVIIPAAEAATLRVRDYTSSGWQPVEIKNLMIVDLTAAFGAGNEPTNEGFLKYVSASYPDTFFAGTKNIPIKDANEKKLLTSVDFEMKWVDPAFLYDMDQLPNSKEFVTMTNNMTYNTNTWETSSATTSLVGDTRIMQATAYGGINQVRLNMTAGRKYWVKATIKASSDKVYLYAIGDTGVYHTGSGNAEILSKVISVPTDNPYLRIRDYSQSGWQPIEISKIMIVDLTTAFGEGNEPTDAEMLSYVRNFSPDVYFDGTQMVEEVGKTDFKILSPQSGKLEWVEPSSVIYNHFRNKKLVCFGDSITEAGGYQKHISNRTGLETLNVGFGGCRMAYRENADRDQLSMVRLSESIVSGDWSAQETAVANMAAAGDDNTEILNRLKAIDWNTIDYVSVFYGTNDFTGQIPLGAEGDTSETTIHGAVNTAIKNILSTYPHIQMAFFTPMWRARQSSGDGLDATNHPNSSGVYLVEYVDAIKRAAERSQLPVLDLYRTSGVNQYTHGTLLADGLHPNDNGYEHLGNKLGGWLLSTY